MYHQLSTCWTTTFLLQRLESSYGLKKIPLLWFKSYLSGSTHMVIAGNSRSKWMPVFLGVPQGSVLCHLSPLCWWRPGLRPWSSICSTHLSSPYWGPFSWLAFVDVFQSPLIQLFQNATHLAWNSPATYENWPFASLWKHSSIYLLYLCAWLRCHFGRLSHFLCTRNQPYTFLLLSPQASQSYSQIRLSCYHDIII